MLQIIKRDGSKVDFNEEKIVNAVLSAFEEVDSEVSDYAMDKAGRIADYVREYAENADHCLDVEEVQDIVERGLQSTRRKDVAKAFIIYREDRTRERNKRSQLVKTIGEKLFAKNVENANANMDEKSFGGRKGEASNILMKDYALNYCMTEMSRNNHLNNEIYIHKLNCA